MVAALTGRLGDGASVRVTYPAAMRSSSRIRCTHALIAPGARRPGASAQGASRRAGLSPGRRPAASRAAPWGAARLPDLGERRDQPERADREPFPPRRGPHTTAAAAPSPEKLRQALEAINGTG